MKSIAFMSQKGGSGKTTLAVHVAVAAAAAGEKVVLIDTDPQASATAWADARRESAIQHVAIGTSELEKVLEAARADGVTLALIDTAPHAAPGATKATAAADFVVIPCRPSAFDLGAAGAALGITRAARRRAAFVLNACPARAPETAEARRALRDLGEDVAPIAVGDRRAFSRAVASGQAVTEFDADGKAAREVRALWKWIKEKLV
jgi:chromosome partitioning protein